FPARRSSDLGLRSDHHDCCLCKLYYPDRLSDQLDRLWARRLQIHGLCQSGHATQHSGYVGDYRNRLLLLVLGGEKMTKSTNIVWHESSVTKEDRQKLNNHKSGVLWFTGLSGSGKSTVSVALEKEIHALGIRTYLLDGDNVRHGLNKNLGFSPEDRTENIRRIGEVGKLMSDAGVLTLSAFISPYQEDRDQVRALLEEDEFIEIYVKCSVDTCEDRDPKGLYKKARAGEIKGFTGIDAPYEEPVNPEIVIETDKQTLEESVQTITDYLKKAGYLC